MEPLASIVIPAYRSEATIGGCLEGISRQTVSGFEVVVVDSSPDDLTQRILQGTPWVRFFRSPRRLLPHEARNVGIRESRSRTLVMTDPDVYAAPDWLERLLAAHRDANREPIAGAVRCHGQRWLDQGIHLCKYGKWLPGGVRRPVDCLTTANAVVDRGQLEAVGGFQGDQMHGDALLSWQLLESGPVWFEPHAVVSHHHLSSFSGYLRERFVRGIDFGLLRAEWFRFSRWRLLVFFAASAAPIRLARVLLLVARYSFKAGSGAGYVTTLPIVAAGHAAALLGEAVGYSKLLMSGRPGS